MEPSSTILSTLKGLFSVRDTFDHLSIDDSPDFDSDRSIRILGYVLILTLLLGFFLWASIAPLESAARATGVVQAEGKRKTLQHLEGGIVSNILVAEGQSVQQGETLLQLDVTQSRAELRRIEGRIWAAQALVDRLTSEREGRDTILFSPYLLSSRDLRAISAVENERTMFSARLSDLQGELGLIKQRKEQYYSELEGLRLVAEKKRLVVESVETELSDLRILLDDGYVDKQRIRQLERSLSETLGEVADLESRIAVAAVSVKEAELQAAQVMKRFKTKVTDELGVTHEKLFDLQQLRAAIDDRVKRATVKAPISGVVLDLKPNVTGAVVSPGQSLLSLVPDASRLVVSARLSPQDIDRVNLGQEVEMTFSVFKGSYAVSGILHKVSADSLIDEITGGSYYSAQIEIDEKDLALLNGKKLVPGMPVSVLIKTGRRTLMSYLTSPIKRGIKNSLIED